MIFSTVRAPQEPAFTVGSFATTSAGRPSTRPCPVTTPSAGRPAAEGVRELAVLDEAALVEQQRDPVADVQLALRGQLGGGAVAAAVSVALAWRRHARRSACVGSPLAVIGVTGQAEAAGDDHALHLGGALADLEDLGVPVEPGHRVSSMKPLPPKTWVAIRVAVTAASVE